MCSTRDPVTKQKIFAYSIAFRCRKDHDQKYGRLTEQFIRKIATR